MASQTERYSLTTLGSGDRISDNDFKYVSRDRETIDYLLGLGAELHHHDGAEAEIGDPETGLSYVLVEDEGYIPAGKTLYYKFSYVNEQGAETAASPAISVVTPAAVATPGLGTLTMETTGGSLLPGNYYYVLTAWETANTNETRTSGSSYITVPRTTTAGIITITLPSLPANADGFNIYRRGPGSSQYFFLASVDMTVATPPSSYDDDGSVAVTVTRSVPRSNTTQGANSVELTVPGGEVLAGYTWKVYRTETEDTWENSLLAWVVEETTEGSGIITPEYVDNGSAGLAQGQPLDFSVIAGSPSKILLTDGAEVEGLLPLDYIEGYAPYSLDYLHETTFYVSGPVEVHEGTQVWICPFEFATILGCRASVGRDAYPSSDAIIVDVNRFFNGATPGWESIYSNPVDQPTIVVGDMIGDVAPPTDTVTLDRGDALTVDVDQSGGGATPTDYDLTVTIYMIVSDSEL